MIKWIFFDWGGTLKDEIAIYRGAAAIAAGVLVGRGFPVDQRRLYDRLIELERSDQAMRVETALAEQGAGDEHVRAAVAAIEDARITTPSPSYEGVEESLEQLRSRYRLGLISNHRAGLDLRLQMDALGGYFEVAVGSGDVGVSKPAPKIFETALERAACAPGEAVMIGDRLNKDIAGAKSAGIMAIRIRQGIYADQEPEGPHEEPDAEISDIRELPGLFL